jgi:hypothetical protein
MKKQYFSPVLILVLFTTVSYKNSAISTKELSAPAVNILTIQPKAVFPDPEAVNIKGFLGDAIKISEEGRLLSLPGWNDEQLIKIFSPESRMKSTTNDWLGEHAGKWLYSTALAVNRTSDEKLKSLLFKTADYLVSTQEKDGYMGTYSLPENKPESYFARVSGPAGIQGQAFELHLPDRNPLLFLPYFEAAKRTTNIWRLTWIQNKVEF